ncbi:MAG TPA: CHRD domain-containing protein [Casimicrobiaceae bacterium]|nr:CHRD domain-containing protein [Casimicrobiaceae bacterium]
MNSTRYLGIASAWAAAAAAGLALSVHSGLASSDEIKIVLSGSQEIPPVTTNATATGVISVGADRSVRGSVTVAGISPTAAHIHEAPAGKNGPIVIPLTQSADAVWTVPEGAKFTDAQFESYRAGNLYYNVHSAAYKGGELRGQIKP